MSQEYESWDVQARRAAIGLSLFVAVLVTGVVGTGLWYRAAIEPRTHAPATRFPAPELETIDTAPSDRTAIETPPPPPGIGRAMAETAAQGDALWKAGR